MIRFHLAVLLAATFALLPMALPAASGDPLYLTMELQVDPARRDEFLEMMTVEAQETRDFDGCRHFAILVDEEQPGRVLFYEIWDSREHYEAYRTWRMDTGFGDVIGPFMTAPPRTAFWSLADE